ncbi:MAG TPA: hypothetical protein VMS86_08500 [Thermoanaerobaculia bacterium]|nr:hypothetical protein [Thermoanaerobaculia bacterium]
MKSRGLATFIFGSLALLGPDLAAACGDKIVDISRGVRFQRAASVQTGAVLIFTGDASAKSIKELRASLSRVGHQVEVVGDLSTLRRELEATSYDVVIAALPDAELVAGILGDPPWPTRLVPFVERGSGGELAAAKREHGFVLSVPGKANDQILTVDAALRAVAIEAIAHPSDR